MYTAEDLIMSYSVILVIDDDERFQKMLSFLLMKKGFKVMHAEDGFAAIRLLETLIPDIILLDLAMPGMDGFELCRKIKEDAVFGKIPIIVISAFLASDQRERILSLGVMDYFEKPFVPSFLSKVSSVISPVTATWEPLDRCLTNPCS